MMHLNMRITPLLSSFFLVAGFLATAAPFPATSDLVSDFTPHSDTAASLDTNAAWQHIEPIHTDPADSAESASLYPSQRRERKAHIVVPCQDCADAFPLFVLELAHHLPGQCEATFSINGTAIHLSASSPSTDLFLSADDPDSYHLSSELTCTSEVQTGDTTVKPVISVSINRSNGKALPARSGFTVTADFQEPLSGIHIFQEVHEGDLTATSTVHVTDYDNSHKHAIELIEHADSLRDDLKQKSLLSATPAPTNSTLSATDAANSTTACPVTHHDLACVAHAIGKQLCDTFATIVVHLKSVASDLHIPSFRSGPQAVINMKASPDCKDCGAAELGSIEKSPTALDVDPVSNITKGAPPDRPQRVHPFKVQSPLAIALEALAAFVGLGTLLTFIHQRCCSLRRRVERLADREERIKRKEYARAARQEAWRRRWAKLRRTCTCCFGSADDDDDVEKAALMNNAAASPYDDLAVDPEVVAAMAQTEGLHYAHEIVTAMMRTRHHHGVNAPHLHHNQPFMHATNTRSRTSSSSLPSYNSEVLPDYSSQPGSSDLERNPGMRVADGFRPARVTFAKRAPSPGASSTGSSACTPDSSIPEISPRPSAETLRTASSRA